MDQRDPTQPLLTHEAPTIVRFIKDRVLELQAGIRDEHQRARVYEDLYMGRRPGRGDKRANVHVPKVFSAIETVIPRLVGPFLGLSTSPVKAKARTPDSEIREFPVNAVLWWDLQRDRALAQLDPILRSACKFGNGWFQVVPQTYRSVRRSKYYLNGALALGLTVKEDAVVETRPHLQFLPYWDVWPDTDAMGLEDDQYYDVAYRFWLRLDQLHDLQADGVFQHVEAIEYRKELGRGDLTNESWRSIMATTTGTSQQRPSSQVPLIECHRYETSKEFVVIAPQQDVLLMGIANPYWHEKKTIRTTPYVPREGSIKGIGMIEHIESLQIELDDKRNQRLDIVNLIVNPAMQIRRGELPEEKDFALYPGRAFRVTEPGKSMVPFVIPDSSRPLHTEEDRLRYDMDETTATTEFIRGIQTAKGDVTATEVDIKTRQASTRFVYTYNLITDYTLRVAADYFLAYEQQFVNQREYVRVAGERGTIYPLIGPEEIQGQFDFYTIVDPMHDDDRIRVNQMLQVAQTFQQVPGFNLMAWGRRTALLMGQDPNEMFPGPAAPGASPGAMPSTGPPGASAMTPLEAYRAVTQPQSAAPVAPPAMSPLTQVLGGSA